MIRCKWILLAPSIFPMLLFGKKVNPKDYTQFATVTSVSSKSEETGATVRNDFDPCSAVAEIHRARCESQRQPSKTRTNKYISYAVIRGVFDGTDYTALGECFLRPGSYKVRANGLNIGFLVKNKRGKPAECQFRITEQSQAQTKRSEPAKAGAAAQTPATGPSLSETLQWLSGASEEESGDGNDHISFKNNACSVTITETRLKAGPKFWVKESFSLADIDPSGIQVENLDTPGPASVRFHTTDYRKKIVGTSDKTATIFPQGVSESSYSFTTNDRFAPRFAKALKHAVELCGGKRSAF